MTAGQAGDVGVGDRLTSERLADVLATVCERLGLDHRGARLLKFTANAVFRLERQPVVVRILGSSALRHRVEKVVRVASWFAEHGVPAVRLVPHIDQPVRVGGFTATVWEAEPGDGPAPRGADLGRLLRQVHSLPLPPFELPVWDPVDDVRRRIGDAEGLDEASRLFLLDQCDEVREALEVLEFQLPTSVVHGDAHLGNLIPTPDGPVLCDFDATCVGPPELDLTPLAVATIRFGDPVDRYRELVRTYGVDVTRWSGFPVLRKLRELKIVTSVLPIMVSNPSIRPELLSRLDDLRNGDISARWRRYA
ncbi:aminoglycoside phosphotransferase (APT) family kinase protein [Herbihabitans rhizosphaerae]|uniref:Aminoglycoside phosphotransferase (APT) family kinase protein n=1 Tax=Herbihabitans rhizosphaerae TaxID=1872711 RepID=A0A4Q7KPB6_9PSEU|nr:aminoglycoside phosphotransferase family protein [Herbihabitans rhizosphaerae]RZS37521.1 aminoglycoside phosphotransferase (APT) family kinase protein [Herbihabitans rhizosphaerae]